MRSAILARSGPEFLKNQETGITHVTFSELKAKIVPSSSVVYEKRT